MSINNVALLATLQAVLQDAADGIISIDDSNQLITYNTAAIRMFGYTAEEVRESGIEILMSDADRDAHAGYMSNYLGGGEHRIIGIGRTVRCRHKSGREFRADLSISETIVGERRIFTAIFRDRTIRDSLEDQVATLGEDLAHSETELQAILRYAPIGIVTMDVAGKIVSVNRAVHRMLSYDVEQLIGQVAVDFVHTDEQLELRATFLDLMRTDLDYSSSIHRIRRADGSYADVRTFNAVLEIPGESEPTLICMMQDVSEQLARDEQIKIQRERLAHMSRLTQLGEMAAGLAHELNQPLGAIANYASAGERLTESLPESQAALVDAFQHIAKQAERAGHIIISTRELTRGRPMHKEVFDVSTLILDMMPLFLIDTRASQIEVVHDLEPDCPIHADPIQMEQVVLNFFRNAVDAVKGQAQARRRVDIRVFRDQQDVVVEVEDTGSGVADDIAGQLFEPFKTSKADGMGMGLSISKTIIEAHGGDIGFRPGAQYGAVFWFRLPVSLPETAGAT